VIEVAQFTRKVKTHGLLPALFYSAEYLVRPLWRKIWIERFLKSYSQRFEDLIIDEILGNKNPGTYLDIGAYDPHRLSNTKRFYDRGWRGCNVEPNPRRFERFVQNRPDDINLNIGLSDSDGKLTFYDVVPEAYSTFSAERVEELKKQGAKIRGRIEVPVITMKDLFARYLSETTVDFCTIDTEGLDLRILEGNDWSKFRPRVICVEVSLSERHQEGATELVSVESFLATAGYVKYKETIEFGVALNEIFVSEVGHQQFVRQG